MMRRRVRKPSAWQPSKANTREAAWEVRQMLSFFTDSLVRRFSWTHLGQVKVTSFFIALDAEERARIYSSDSDEGSDDDKAQRLMKAKKLDSDEVGVRICWTDRRQCDTAGWRLKKCELNSTGSTLCKIICTNRVYCDVARNNNASVLREHTECLL